MTELKKLIQTQEIIKEQIEFQKIELNQTEEAIFDIIEKPINQARLQQGKDTGVINLEIEGVEVKHDLPKKVVWEQDEIKQIIIKIKNAGDDPNKYTTVKYSVSEKQFKNFPPAIQTVFMQAREVKTGKAKTTFKIEEED